MKNAHNFDTEVHNFGTKKFMTHYQLSAYFLFINLPKSVHFEFINYMNRVHKLYEQCSYFVHKTFIYYKIVH